MALDKILSASIVTGLQLDNVTTTSTGSSTTGAGQVYLNGATSNRVDFNTNGVAAPAYTTRSAGTKVALYPALGASSVDYAFGIDAGVLWASIPGNDGGQFFKWYGGTTQVGSLSGTGMMDIIGTINAASYSIGSSFVANTTSITTTSNTVNFGTAFYSIANGNVGIGTASPGTKLQIGNPSDSNQALRFDFPDSSTSRINSTRVSSGNLQSLLLAGQDTMQFQTNGSERMRIDSSGNVGIGTASPSSTNRLQVSSAGSTRLLVENTTNTVSVRIQTETASGLVQTDTNHPLNFATNNGAVAMQIDTSGNLKFNSGYGSAATAYGCRAWANWDGTSATPSTIRGSGNITSITKNGTGDYTVNFTTAMPDANYSAVGMSSRNGSGQQVMVIGWSGSAYYAPTSSTIRVQTFYPGSGLVDSLYNFISIFR